MNFETLYKKTSTGADQEWTISTVDNIIVTRWGQCGGKIQETQDVIADGKNTGKSNETTPALQAVAEAQAMWEKKLKKGYVKNLDDARDGKTDASIEGGVFPMLAKKFSEHGHKIVWPAYVQPKFDGHRCIAVVENGECTLWSRTRKLITGVPHINRAVEKVVKGNTILDGELYNHDYHNRFEALTSFIRQETPKEGHEVVEYHIYDLAISDVPFEQRFRNLKEFDFKSPLKLVQTVLVNDEDEMMTAFDDFLNQDYEGLMVRSVDGLYVNKRSADLLKVKEFDDSEFKIIGVEEGRGKLTGHAIFVCETEEGIQFNVKLKGDTAKLKEYFENPNLVVGKILTVQYQGLTKSDVPRFPIGLRFREDI